MARVIHLRFEECNLHNSLMNNFRRQYVVVEKNEKRTAYMSPVLGGYPMPGPTEYTITCLYDDDVFNFIDEYRRDRCEDDLLTSRSKVLEFYLGEMDVFG